MEKGSICDSFGDVAHKDAICAAADSQAASGRRPVEQQRGAEALLAREFDVGGVVCVDGQVCHGAARRQCLHQRERSCIGRQLLDVYLYYVGYRPFARRPVCSHRLIGRNVQCCTRD